MPSIDYVLIVTIVRHFQFQPLLLKEVFRLIIVFDLQAMNQVYHQTQYIAF